ncbi:MAG: SDR family oxidoreductase [Flavisolibacter sp.]
MQKVLVTGANGFVGYYLTEKLLQKGYEVVATGLGGCRLPFEDNHLKYKTLDFTNSQAVESIFSEELPDVVIHCGALSKPDECEQNPEAALLANVTGTLHLLKAAGQSGSFFVFLSTDFVFSGEKGLYKEADERSPVNFYGETKLLAENAVMNYGFSWAIVRTVLVYGKPFLNRQNLLTSVAADLKKGRQLRIFGDQLRTPTYVEDLATGIVRILEKMATGVFHLSGEDILTPFDMAMAVARYLQLDISMISRIEEGDLVQPARRPLKTGLDIEKARRVLDYHPLSFEAGLRKTFS